MLSESIATTSASACASYIYCISKMPVAVLFCALFMLCTPALAKTTIDAGFAKMLVEQNADRGEEGYNQVTAALAGLDNEELARLKALIAEDMATEAEKIVSAEPVERRLARGLLNNIDDRLGALDYDLTLEGKFLESTGAGTVSYYSFKTNEGKVAEVYVGVSTLMPHYGYQENCRDRVRIFVKRGDPAGYVAKIELLEPSRPETSKARP